MENHFLYVILSGIIQGLTEFLPISSSGHLIMIKDYFNYDIQDFSFEIMLHLGTVFSILIYYYNDIKKMLKPIPENFNNAILVIIACLPISIFGLVFKDSIEQNFNDEDKLSDELNKLNKLLKEGVLTQEEFEKAKKKILEN